MRDFARDERGATAIEYTLIASVIVIAILATVPKIGTAVSGLLQGVTF